MSNKWSFKVCKNYRDSQHWEDGSTVTEITYGVEAGDGSGHLWRHFRQDLKEEQAFALCGKIEKHLKAQDDWNPDESEHWIYCRTIYGSQAYQDNYHNEVMQDEKLDFESEFGKGSWNENEYWKLKGGAAFFKS